MGFRALKKDIRCLLVADDFQTALAAFDHMAERQAVNPLLSFFYDTDTVVRWHAITAFGRVLDNLARKDIESARVVMRRLMWNLNDESGGIGWGSPEAMGETMALHAGLADQYSHILVSYINPNGNFLEHEVLQRGLLWGLGRLAQVRPERLQTAVPFLHPFLQSHDPIHRGLAAWVIGALQDASARHLLKPLTDDNMDILFYFDLRVQSRTVAKFAEDALFALIDT
ncbi:DVU0298 family protein [Thermodesulfobacteriota bacterium]